MTCMDKHSYGQTLPALLQHHRVHLWCLRLLCYIHHPSLMHNVTCHYGFFCTPLKAVVTHHFYNKIRCLFIGVKCTTYFCVIYLFPSKGRPQVTSIIEQTRAADPLHSHWWWRMVQTLATGAGAHRGQKGLGRHNIGTGTVHSAKVSCEIAGDISTVRTLRTLVGFLPRVGDHVSSQEKLFVKPVKLPATLRARQGRRQVPRAWITACLARGVKARYTVGLVQARRWRGAPHQGTAPRQPLKHTKASSHPQSGSCTTLMHVFLHPKTCLMPGALPLGAAAHSLSCHSRASEFIHQATLGITFSITLLPQGLGRVHWAPFHTC